MEILSADLDSGCDFLHHACSEWFGVSMLLLAKKLIKCLQLLITGTALAVIACTEAIAGGGLVLKNDLCIIEIDFYSAHFTAYQPATRGNKQFCQELPDTGETIFVLDYLHPSLKQVPVSLRIIHDVTEQGDFVKLKHVEEIEDIDSLTVFYQPPVIRPDASFQADFELLTKGRYIGIVTAGHPSNDKTYTAVFQFNVGGLDIKFMVPMILLFMVVAIILISRWLRARRDPQQPEVNT